MAGELLQSVPAVDTHSFRPVQHLDLVLQQADFEVDHTSVGDLPLPSVHVSNRLPHHDGEHGDHRHIPLHKLLVRWNRYSVQSTCMSRSAPCQLVPVHSSKMVRFR